MISTIVARRYAKALFAIAKEAGKLEAVSGELEAIVGYLEKAPEVEEALVSPVYPADLKGTIIEEILKAIEAGPELRKFLELLVERRRIQVIRAIQQCYQEFMDEEMGVKRAVVTTAIPMPQDLTEKLKDILAKITGKDVVLELREDPSIIGGVVAHIGDMVWDGSIRSQLQGFKESIGRGELG